MTSENIHTSYETVRAHDPDRYLSALMAPRRVRDSLMALYAFNTELARIPNLVTEPALGEIRLQWWRDIVDHMGAGNSSGAAVADALGHVHATHDFPKPMLLGMIDARSADLDGGGFSDLQALKAYLYKSEGAVFALSARILGAANAEVGSTANLAGLACGLTNLLRKLASDVASGRIMLPLSMLDTGGVTPEQILAGTGVENLKPVLMELAGEARAARDAAARKLVDLDDAVRPAFAPLALVEPYLKAMAKREHRALRDIADINPLVRFWKLWRAS